MGEPYDSITSSYLGLMVVSIFAVAGALIAMIAYCGALFVGSHRQLQ